MRIYLFDEMQDDFIAIILWKITLFAFFNVYPKKWNLILYACFLALLFAVYFMCMVKLHWIYYIFFLEIILFSVEFSWFSLNRFDEINKISLETKMTEMFRLNTCRSITSFSMSWTSWSWQTIILISIEENIRFQIWFFFFSIFFLTNIFSIASLRINVCTVTYIC